VSILPTISELLICVKELFCSFYELTVWEFNFCTIENWQRSTKKYKEAAYKMLVKLTPGLHHRHQQPRQHGR